MALFWGEQLLQFYNDAMMPVCATRNSYPATIGLPAAANNTPYGANIYEALQEVKRSGNAVQQEELMLPLYHNNYIENAYWTLSYSAVYDESGSIGGILCAGADMTRQVAMRARLEETEDEHLFAIEATGLGIWDYNPNTNKFLGNDRLREWFGLKPAAEIDLSLAIAVIAPEDRSRVAEAIRQALRYESGGFYDVEYTIIHPHTGERRIVNAKGRAWFDKDQTASRFNGTLQDITVRKEAQMTSEKQKRLYDTITASTPDLIYVFDLNYHFLYANDALLNMWGRTRDEAIGLGLRPLGYEEWHAEMHEREIDRIVATKQPVRGTVSFPHATLGRRVYDYILVPVIGDNNEVEAVAGTTRDITDLKLAEDAIRQSEERYRTLAETLELQVTARTGDLLRSNEELFQFAHVASHDLKEPVRKIKFFTSILAAESTSLSERGKVSLEKIQSAASRMATMINGVLAYSTLNATEQDKELIDLNNVIQGVMTDLEVVIQQKEAHIYYDKLPQINGAPVLIYQLFYNLVNNSLKFSRPDIPPVVHINSSSSDEAITITVSDNGIGFEPEYAESIFKTFARLHSKDHYEGTGLGLSLCRRITERHGGTITAEGSDGAGAKFIITLPVE